MMTTPAATARPIPVTKPTRQQAVLLSAALVTVAAMVTVVHTAPKHRRATVLTAGAVLDVCVTAAPDVAMDFTATPDVTTPQLEVARFSVLPLPSVAAVVLPRRLNQLCLARIGGLHGP
jgi:hypothetical protein